MEDSAAANADGILRLNSLLDARLSPDGSQVAYTVCSVDPDTGQDGASIWLADLESGGSERLPTASSFDSSPAWTPDGRSIVYRSLDGGLAQVRRLDLAAGVDDAVTDAPYGIATLPPALSGDGRWIAYVAPVAPPRDPTAPYRVTKMMWRLDGVGVIDDAIGEVFVIASSGGEPRQLTAAGDLVAGVHWYPGSDRIAVQSVVDRDDPRFELRSHRADGGGSVLVGVSDFLLLPPAMTIQPDGRVVTSGPHETIALGGRTKLMVLSGDAPDRVERELPDVAGAPFGLTQADFPTWEILESPRLVGDPAGQRVYLPVQRSGRGELWAVSADGNAEAHCLLSEDGVAVPLDASESHVLVALMTMHEPPDLWLVPADGGSPRRVTRLNPAFAPESFFTVHPLAVTGDDGEPIDAWFLAPRGSQGPVATILNNHGGPHAAWGHAFVFDNCCLAQAGYGTLLVNQRGSTGTTTEFAQQINGCWGEHEYRDLQCAVDAAVAAGLADPDRLGVWGISAGGYLTARLITKTDRFKAAVVENPTLDMFVMLGADLGWMLEPWFGAMLGRGPDAAAHLAAQSPITDAERCDTPTLLIQHERDWRCPAANLDQFYFALRAGGCKAEMLRMPLTSHNGSIGLGSPPVRVAQNEALLDWFGRHLPLDASR